MAETSAQTHSSRKNPQSLRLERHSCEDRRPGEVEDEVDRRRHLHPAELGGRERHEDEQRTFGPQDPHSIHGILGACAAAPRGAADIDVGPRSAPADRVGERAPVMSRQELGSERFIAHPVSHLKEGRLRRFTGQRVQVRP
jgi:hypothetical protein